MIHLGLALLYCIVCSKVEGVYDVYFNDNVKGLRRCGCNGNRRRRPQNDDIEVSPTETVVNTRTRKRVVKHVHPTEVINVNRKVIKNKHFYPVNEREVNETVVEDYDCGSDINNPRCRRVSGNNNNNNGCGGNNNNSCGCHKHHCNCRNR